MHNISVRTLLGPTIQRLEVRVSGFGFRGCDVWVGLRTCSREVVDDDEELRGTRPTSLSFKWTRGQAQVGYGKRGRCDLSIPESPGV